MRRIKVLLMLLAIVAGGSFAYGQTSPQDTYYKFNQTYAAGATVAPDEGNGGNLTVGQAVIAKNPAAEYMQNTYSYGISAIVNANGTKVTRKMLTFHVEASTDNPAHILLICKDYYATNAANDNYWGIFVASNSQWVTRQIIRTSESNNEAFQMGCYEFVVNETNDYDLSAVGVRSSGRAEVYELRVIYEKNALYQSIRNSLAIEFDNSTTTANRATTSFFRLSQTRPFDEVNGVQTLGGGVYFRPYANGTIVVDLINNTANQAIIALDSILVFGNAPAGIMALQTNPVEPNSTVNDFTIPRKVYKGGEYRLGYNTGSYIKSVRFIPDHYTVTLDANGGTVDPTELVYIKGGDPITAFPTPTKENYMFDGWDPAAPSFPYAPTADITYTAQWANPSGQCGDNLTWELNPSTGVLTITGTGEMNNFNNASNQPWKNYRNSITNVVIEDGATTIGNSAFTNCSNLASVTIPDGVTLINPAAFMGCTGLASITIPGNVETIQNSAFYGCSSLADVTINRATAPFVSPATFMNIASTATLHVPYGASGYTGSKWNMFTNIVVMNPSGQCGDDLYWEYDPSTTTLTITGTGDMYDYNYTSTTHAPWYDYRNEITAVVLPDGLTKIGNFAFYQCNNASLTSIDIPASVTSIGQGAFNNCTKLASVTIPSSVTSIGQGAFFKCSSLTSIHIPSGVTSIEGSTFAQCGLTTINIPANVTTIGEDAFEHCNSLAAITLAEGLKSIGARAFMYCYPYLTSINIPASVTSIGIGAFSDCSSLADVTVHWETNIPTPANYAFDGIVSPATLHVPCGTKSVYEAEETWNSFTIDDPCEGIYPITAKADPDNAGIYYSTFYDGLTKYAVPANVEAYAASVNGSDLVLTKIAEANEVLPAGTAVILKSTVDSYTMVPSDGTAVTITATNHLHGVDADTEISSVVTSGTCYVLSYKSGYGVGFYLYEAPNQLKAHKAYINLDDSGAAQAPRHLRFVFNSTTGIEDVQGEKVQGEKILRDGVLYIQRGEQLYNAQGMKVQ
ncbi:MAG: leucine-rich repeat protein [Paludibacteraceae bacterium]|nr:leucine-rich repeat protein [Paludibacteraceae bacterium]